MSVGEFPLIFEECDREVCVDIQLIDDLVLEDTERFKVIVSKSDGTSESVILEESERLYTIVDVDGESPVRVYTYTTALPTICNASITCDVHVLLFLQMLLLSLRVCTIQ